MSQGVIVIFAIAALYAAYLAGISRGVKISFKRVNQMLDEAFPTKPPPPPPPPPKRYP